MSNDPKLFIHAIFSYPLIFKSHEKAAWEPCTHHYSLLAGQVPESEAMEYQSVMAPFSNSRINIDICTWSVNPSPMPYFLQFLDEEVDASILNLCVCVGRRDACSLFRFFQRKSKVGIVQLVQLINVTMHPSTLSPSSQAQWLLSSVPQVPPHHSPLCSLSLGCHCSVLLITFFHLPSEFQKSVIIICA